MNVYGALVDDTASGKLKLRVRKALYSLSCR
jgi:hypothetical protein